MLMTDFSAGELSPALFGRVDIGPYYRGAGLLENFLVMPTGGIKKRRGTTRRAALGGECRIIPFILDRGTSYIIELGPGRFRLWKNGLEPVTPELAEGTGLYGSMEAVRAAQYAQHYDTMIFVHRDYPPLELKRAGEGAFTLSPLAFGYSGDAVITDEWGKYDGEKTASIEPIFSGPGAYPGAAAFFGGRLWLASSNKERQKVWASAAPAAIVKDSAGKILAGGSRYNSFMPFTRYVTQMRVLIEAGLRRFTASVTHNSNLLKNVSVDFLKPGMLLEGTILGEYYVYSPENFFPVGTKPYKGKPDANTLNLTENAVFPPGYGFLTAGENQWLGDKETAFEDYFNNHEIAWSGNGLKYQLRAGGTLKQLTVTLAYVTAGPADIGTRTINYTLPVSKTAFLGQYDNAMAEFRDGGALDIDLDKGEFNSLAANCRNALDGIYETFLTNVSGGSGYGSVTFRGELWTGDGSEDLIQKIRDKYDTLHNVELVLLRWQTPDAPAYKYPVKTEDVINPDNAFFFEIASDMSDEIKWLANLRGLIIGTETAEWLVPAGVSAVNIQAAINSRNGSADMQAAAAGDGLVFFKAGRKAVVEYAYPQASETFASRDLAALAPQMIQESPAADYDFVSAPYNKIIVVRKDGTAALLLYDKSSGLAAWSRIRLGSGLMRSCAAVPGSGGYDDLYFAVQDGNAYYLEVLEEDAGPWQDGWAGGSGRPVAALMRSMPVTAGDPNQKKRIAALAVRFLDSSLPVLTALPGGARQIITGLDEPFSGVCKTPFPSAWDRDVFFEISHSGSGPCVILAVNAEVQ
ncbi:MAG: hypothetical protein LBO80_04925 [Treponema sp.]|jgi:hypothetical protein|nr:hypothetical protein [Treponema sp.]